MKYFRHIQQRYRIELNSLLTWHFTVSIREEPLMAQKSKFVINK